MRTIDPELVWAFLAIAHLDDILERSELKEMAYAWIIHLDTPLLMTLVERWDQDCYSFHLPTGEMNITLLDVYQI